MKTKFFIFIFFILSLFYFFYSKQRVEVIEDVKINPSSVLSSPMQNAKEKDRLLERSETKYVDNKLAPLQFPTKDQIKDEVSKDPHTVPESLLNFAQKAGEKLGQALQSIDKASGYVDELDSCLSISTDRPTAIQSVCLDHLRVVVEKFPELKTRSENIILMNKKK